MSGLRCVTFFVILVMAVCFDSEESNESVEDLILNQHRANRFFIPRRYNNYNSYQWGVKSQDERRSEICEDYFYCRQMARQYGYHQAYQKFFGGRQGNNYYYRQRY